MRLSPMVCLAALFWAASGAAGDSPALSVPQGGRIPAAKDIEELVHRLGDDDETAGEDACSHKSIEELVHRLGDDDETAGEDACSHKSIEELIHRLGDDDFNVRESADAELRRAGRDALTALQKAAREHPQFEGRRRSDGILLKLEEALLPSAVVHVVDLSQAGSSYIRASREIRDVGKFCGRLVEESSSARPSPGRRVWECLGTDAQELVKEEARLKRIPRPASEGFTRQHFELLGRFQKVFEQVMDRRDFYDRRAFDPLDLSLEVRELAARRQELSPLETRRLNRLLFQAAFPTDVVPCEDFNGPPEVVKVKVKQTPKPVILVLTSYRSVRWLVEPEDGVQILRVYVTSYDHSEMSGTHARRFILNTVSSENRERSLKYRANDKDHEDFPKLVKHVRELTGHEISTFQAQNQHDGRAFVISTPRPLPAIPANAELHVINVSAEHLEFSPLAHVSDRPGFLQKLVKDAARPSPSPARRLWELFSRRVQYWNRDHRFPGLAQLETARDRKVDSVMDRTLVEVMQHRYFYEPKSFRGVALNAEARQLIERQDELSRLEVMRLNQLVFAAAFAEFIADRGETERLRGVARVRIARTGKPIVLALCGEARWFVETDPGVQLCRVIVGSNAAWVAGVNAPVVYAANPRDGGEEWSFSAGDSRYYREMARKLRRHTGLEIASFQDHLAHKRVGKTVQILLR